MDEQLRDPTHSPVEIFRDKAAEKRVAHKRSLVAGIVGTAVVIKQVPVVRLGLRNRKRDWFLAHTSAAIVVIEKVCTFSHEIVIDRGLWNNAENKPRSSSHKCQFVSQSQ